MNKFKQLWSDLRSRIQRRPYGSNAGLRKQRRWKDKG
jgi:hypothetical protein